MINEPTLTVNGFTDDLSNFRRHAQYVVDDESSNPVEKGLAMTVVALIDQSGALER